ncbi:4-hydroxy-tetrahydrodipicolinate synthase [Fusobacterium sp.]|uniref:4-hydroxy-tetrahydrodipicolinate synthase n=1 Tax=Fusobacterium sp. TaxID=68766 RepID=UPI002625B5C7|nr:4-hydroxy-tetrahydrodipicolinate synthase [Fusobacterium sp.]
MSIFVGSGVALVTPFDENNQVNYKKLGELLEYHVENKTDAIVISGTTGEASTMTESERLNVIKFTVDKIAKRIPVIAGTGSNSTEIAVEFSKKVEVLGVDGLLVVTPYYNKGNERGIYGHYKEIAESVELPIILYNVPGRTGVNLSVSLVKELAKFKNIVAIKEASGNISYAAEIARQVPELDIYSGNDDMTVPILSLGGKGVISVSANIIPEVIHNMVMSFLNGDSKEACRLQLGYNELSNGMFIETNPVPVKEAMNYLGYEVGGCRLPLGEMYQENIEKLHSIIDRHEVKKWK